MAEGKELKPKSFRIDDETAEKFKEISSAIGGNQQQTLAKLIETYHFQTGKSILTNKRDDIDQFEKYISCLTNMYMRSLEDNQNITDSVRTEFDALLNSKDTIIQNLQSELVTARQLKEEAVIKAKTYSEENARLNSLLNRQEEEYHTRLNDLQDMLTDKDSLNKALIDSCNNLKSKIEGMEESLKLASSIQEELEQLKKKHEKVTQEHANLEQRMRQEQEIHSKSIANLQQHEKNALNQLKEQSQLAVEKAILETECEHQEQVQKIKKQHQAEVDEYQQRYLSLLEQIQRNHEKEAVEKNKDTTAGTA